MKAWILSDLHVDRWKSLPPLVARNADVCICASDISDSGPERAVTYLGENVSRYMPVVLVPGNEDYYRSSIVEGAIRAIVEAAQFPDIHFLDRGIVSIAGHRFIGATLWDCFERLGKSKLALCLALRELKDYQKIKMSERPRRWFSNTHARRLNMEDAAFVAQALEEGSGEPSVVVTHHAPFRRSAPSCIMDDCFPERVLSWAELEIARHRPVAWVHGHYHKRSDYRILDTRVICNPRGYPHRPVPGFDPDFVVDLSRTTATAAAQWQIRSSL